MTDLHPDVTGLAQTFRETELLPDIVQRSCVVVFRWANQPGRPVQYVSPTVERFGYQVEDFTSGRVVFADLIHPGDAAEVKRDALAHINQGADEYRQIYRLRHGQGHWIWIDDFTWLTRDGSGAVTDICGVLLCITQRERFEYEARLQTALRDGERRFRELFEKLPVAITLHDPVTGEILEANRQACRYHEVQTLAELRALNIWDQPEPYSKNNALAWNRKVLDEGQQSFEWRSTSPGGRFFWQAVTLEAIQIDGRVRILAVSIDINEKVQTKQALEQSEERFRGLLAHLPNVAVQGYDQNRRVIFWNRGSEATYGYSAAEAMGRDLIDLLIPPEQRTQCVESIRRLLAGEEAIAPAEIEVCDKQGVRKTVFSSMIPRQSPNNSQEFYCIDVDLTAQKQAQQRLELLAQVFRRSHDGVLVADENATVIEVNDRYCEMTGYHRAELLDKRFSMLDVAGDSASFYTSMWAQVQAQGSWVGELRNRKKSGELYPVEIRITSIKGSDGKVTHYITHVTDITERLSYEEQLRKVASYDSLTGLLNRSSLANMLNEAVTQFQCRKVPFAVVFIDLDEFKAINDGNGHEMGDRYLQGVARRLKSIIREGDTAARFGGDEFVLILQNQHPDALNHPVFNRLLNAMREPIDIDGKAFKLAASFGVTFYPQDSDVDADQLLRQADQAMYSAKRRGKNQVVYFDAEFERAIMTRNTRVEQLRQAIKNGEMCLHYQPQVDMSTGKVLGVEALVRWNHPDAGLLPPSDFIDLTREHEQLGLLLSKWVLSRALDDLEQLLGRGHYLSVSVNTIIPTGERLRTVFLEDLRKLLQQHAGIPPRLLTLEVVENTLTDDISEATQAIAQIQQLGVQISLDDFGTGFSSLSHLKHLSFDELKIDQTFVRDMLSSRDDMTIVQAVVSLSRSFDVSVIGEGVETVHHAEMLLRLGCVKAQGYAISQPLSINALKTWLQVWQPPSAWRHIAPLSPRFYYLIANLSGYTGWLNALGRYIRGEMADAPDWNFRPRDLNTQSGVDTQWRQVQEYERIVHEAGIAAIQAFQRGSGTAESEHHLARATTALQRLQALVWSQAGAV